jgi:hypothetical protein
MIKGDTATLTTLHFTSLHCTTSTSVLLIYLRTGQDRTGQEQSTQYNADHGSGTCSVLSHGDRDSILDDPRQDRTEAAQIARSGKIRV